ncbi:RluA family pseudouridine synthase [Candidatus Riflebacteria bacterium]
MSSKYKSDIPGIEEVFEVVPDFNGMRLDIFLQKIKPEYSRSYFQSLIKKGLCCLNNCVVKANTKVKVGDEVKVFFPEISPIIFNQLDIPLKIIFQTDSYLVIEKPPGLITHPGPDDSRPSVAGIISNRYQIEDEEGFNSFRPGIVHRLDKDTSGLLIIAFNPKSKAYFSQLFKERSVRKCYRAIVKGVITENEGEIDAPIGRQRGNKMLKWQVLQGGRDSLTRFSVLKRSKRFTEVKIFPHSGRTHQIRVHFQFIGHPLVNDPLYSRKHWNLSVPGQLLCAEFLSFPCPQSKKILSFSCQPDSRFEEFYRTFWDL